MKTKSYLAIAALACVTILAGCGGGGGGGGFSPPPPPPPPPPAVPMSAAGIWVGQALTPAIPDVTTSFEGPDAANGFVVGTSPFSANFQGGVTETRGISGFYADGDKSWHIAGNNAGVIDATVTFETPISTLSFFTRTVTNGNVATIDVKDTNGVVIQTIVPPDANTPLIFNVNTAGGLPIASMDITISSGEIVIDSFTFGYASAASTDDFDCLFASNGEFVCLVSDAISGAVTATANGTYQVNGDQVSGSGNLYAAPGQTLVGGATIAPMTISAGTVVGSTSLNLTINSSGRATTVTSAFDATYDRGSALATVAAVYTMVDILGGMAAFAIDATGVISGATATACVLSGQVSIIDATANEYDVNLVADAATCGAAAGNYNGLGTTQDQNATDDEFIFLVFVDGQSMILGQAIK